MRQPISPLIKIAVAHRSAVKRERNGGGIGARLLLDQRVDALLARIIGASGVEPLYHFLQHKAGDVLDLGDALIGVCDYRPQQRLVACEPPHNRSLVEEVGVVVAVDAQPVRRLDDVPENIVVDEGLRIWLDIDRQFAGLDLVRQPLEVELKLRQWKSVDLARRRELPHDRAQRTVLLLVCVEDLSADRAQMVDERRFPGPTAADRQEINAMADKHLIPDQRLSCGRDRDHKFLDPGQSPHQRLKSGEKRHEERATLCRAGSFTAR